MQVGGLRVFYSALQFCVAISAIVLLLRRPAMPAVNSLPLLHLPSAKTLPVMIIKFSRWTPVAPRLSLWNKPGLHSIFQAQANAKKYPCLAGDDDAVEDRLVLPAVAPVCPNGTVYDR